MPTETSELINTLSTLAGSLVPYLKQPGVSEKHRKIRQAIRALKKDPENGFLMECARQLTPNKTKFDSDSE